MLNKWQWRLFAALLSGFFVFHLILLLYVADRKPDYFLCNDGDEYLELAESFVKTGSMTIEKARYYEAPRDHVIPEAYRSLLLPFCSVPFIYAAGSSHSLYAVAILQALLTTAFAAIMFLLTLRLTKSALAAFAAILLLSLHPMFFMFSLTYSSELLFIVLLAGFLLCALAHDSIMKYVLMGICCALAVWTRASALAILPVATVLFTLFPFTPGKWTLKQWRRYLYPAIFGGVFLLCVLPLGIRSYVYFGTFKLGTSLGGFSAAIGNSRENLAAYRSGAEFMVHQGQVWDRMVHVISQSPPEFADNPFLLNSYLFSVARQQVLEMGLYDSAVLMLYKAWHFIRPWSNYGIHPPLQFWGFAIFETLFFALGLAGIFMMRKQWRMMIPFLALFLSGWIPHAILQTHMRYRVTFLDLALIPFAAFMIAQILMLLKRKYAKSNVPRKSVSA